MNQRLPGSPGTARPPAAAADDEISLVDLWIVLAERKWLVLGVAVVALLAAAGFGAMKTPMYESRAVIEVGRLGGTQVVQVESPGLLVERLREEYRVGDRSEGSVAPPFVKDVSLEKGTNSVAISVSDLTAEGAKQYAAAVTGRVLTQHERLFNQAFAAQRQRLDSLTRQLQAFDAQLASLSEHIESLRESDPSQSAILTLERGNLLAQRPSLEQQRAELEISLSGMSSQPSRLIREPTLPVEPANDRLALYVALGLVLGLMLGVFAAFFSAFLERSRAELKARRAGG